MKSNPIAPRLVVLAKPCSNGVEARQAGCVKNSLSGYFSDCRSLIIFRHIRLVGGVGAEYPEGVERSPRRALDPQ